MVSKGAARGMIVFMLFVIFLLGLIVVATKEKYDATHSQHVPPTASPTVLLQAGRWS